MGEEELDHEAIRRRCTVIRSGSLSTSDEEIAHLSQALKNSILRIEPLYKIVLTGGPCGGKTTALARLSYYLRERGFEVMTVPEAFTIMASNGFSMEYFSVGGMPFEVQNAVMDMQIALEDSFERILRARGKPSVMLCDRGLMDGAAYVTSEEWDSFCNTRGVSSIDLREGRYNAVFHLVTAAEGAEQFYTLENNEARTETAEEARQLDVSSRRAWVGHHSLSVFDNSTDFEGKMQRLVDATARLVGLPSNLHRVARKYLLRSKPNLEDFPESVKYQVFDVEKVYLYDGTNEISEGPPQKYAEEYSFIRKRTQIGEGGGKGTSYGLTVVSITHDRKVIEVKRIINAREYASAFKTRDLTRHVVRQQRISFLWNMQSFNIHIYNEPDTGLCILHAQVNESRSDNKQNKETDNTFDLLVDMPSFLHVERRITSLKEDNEKYGAFNISLIKN
uniref:NadR/Ttd14 AAA domain-containing protein n=1 Tax=Eucampia antarctica TaxID=49252 RepID=A0A7S2W782_9STRA